MLWPQADGDLSVFMHRLRMAHTMKWHHAHRSLGTGPLYQGRFKPFPLANDAHFLKVCRYVERNPLRANLVGRAGKWRWSSQWHRLNPGNFVGLADWPTVPSANWVEHGNEPQTEVELLALHNSVRRGIPFHGVNRQRTTADRLGIQLTPRPRGRPSRPRRASAE